MAAEFPETDLWDRINDGWDGMSREQRRLWEEMKRPPELWTLRGYGQCWIVGLIGQTVFYFNHYEDGFERSGWTQYGTIDDFQSLQWTLGEAVQRQLEAISTGYDVAPRSSAPVAGIFKSPDA